MHLPSAAKSAILASVLVVSFFIGWELYLRHKGYEPDYDDGPELWANSRSMVYEPSDKAIVFIGSSRIKYDLDIREWHNLTGIHAIQLAMTGSSPRLILTDLANDPKFRGRLIIDVTEGLFFGNHGDTKPAGGIAYYKQRTLSQQASLRLGWPLESKLVFLNSGQFSVNALLGKMHVPDRPGTMPFLDFPAGFEFNRLNRQVSMTPDFVADTNQINQVKGIWAMFGKMAAHEPPASGKALDNIMQSVKADIDKIRARGGQVLFVRTPSSGPAAMGEKMGYPRALYWDRLLAITGCEGIHYADYPATAHLICPEWSHLIPQDALVFTRTFVAALQTKKDWKF